MIRARNMMSRFGKKRLRTTETVFHVPPTKRRCKVSSIGTALCLKFIRDSEGKAFFAKICGLTEF
jgi:hypothetical protein